MTTIFLSHDVIDNYLNWFVYLTIGFVQSPFSHLIWSCQLSSRISLLSVVCSLCLAVLALDFVIGVLWQSKCDKNIKQKISSSNAQFQTQSFKSTKV